jgi:hypothetical protein
MKKIIQLALLLLLPAATLAQTAAYPNGVCTAGATKAVTQGLNSTNQLLGMFPGCTVSVFLAGTTNLATIFLDHAQTPLGNPFTANTTTGLFVFWADGTLRYDIQLSGAGMPTTTIPNVLLTAIPQIVLTTNGTSGPSTLINGVLNVPNYSTGGGGAGNPASPPFCVQFANSDVSAFQCDSTAGFTTASAFSYNPTTHDLVSRLLNNIPFASQFQTGGGNNGIANALTALGTNQVVIVDNGDGGNEVNNVFSPSTPDNSTIIDQRSPGNTVNFGAPGVSVTQRNPVAANPPFATAFIAIPYSTSVYNVWSNSNGDNNLLGAYAQMVGSFRDGPGADYGNDWTVTQGLGVNTADYAPGISDGLAVSMQKNGPGDINLFGGAFITSGGQGTEGSDQGFTGYSINGGQADVRTMTTVASVTGQQIVPSTITPGSPFYNRLSAGITDWMIDMNASTLGSTGSLTGAYVWIENAGNGMTNGTYTVTCTGGGGSGGTLQATVISNTLNIVSGVRVLSPGSGYTSAPTCAGWTPGGTPATLIPVIAAAGQMGTTTTAPGSTYVPMMTVSGITLVPSTGDVVTSSSAPRATNPGTNQTDTITAVVNNNHPLVAGLAWKADGFPERVNIISVSGGTTTGSTQTITVQHQTPIESASNWYQGGTQGCLLQDANFVQTAILMCDYAFGAFDSTHLIYGKLSHGGLNVVHLPNMFANTTSGVNGFHIFAGAQVQSVAAVRPGDVSTTGGQPTLEFNNVPWVAGDFLAQPMATGFDVTGVLAAQLNSNAPSDNGDALIFMSVEGGHWDANLIAARFVNNNGANLYQNNGGALTEPNGIFFQGTWANFGVMNAPPSSSVLQVTDEGQPLAWLSGTLGLTSDPPNNRWDMGGAGLKMTGNLFANTLTYSQSPGIGSGNQSFTSNPNGIGGFFSSLGSTLNGSDATLGLQEVDAGTIHAGTTIPIPGSTFFIAGSPATGGSTTYSWVAVSETSSGGKTLPSSALTSTTGPATLTSLNFYHLSGLTSPGAQFIDVYRTAGASVGLICHLTALQIQGAGCIDQGQAASGAVPTADTSGVLTVATSGTIAAFPIPVVDNNTPTVGLAVCIKAVGPPIQLGTCSTTPTGGACTCN